MDVKSACPRTSSSASSTREEVPVNGLQEWWLARATSLPRDRRNGWVVSAMIEEFRNETVIANACGKPTFAERMREAGLGDLLLLQGPPRKRVKLLAQGGRDGLELLDEAGQRAIMQAISRSLPAYGSGVRCWAAFCDAVGVRVHFPATERLVIRYASIFTCAETYQQYLKHLRWAHRFLHMECTWYTDTVKQVPRGAASAAAAKAPKVALVSRQVRDMVGIAMKSGELEIAALLAISRMFLLRVPSEGIPLTWSSSHSTVDVSEHKATIRLSSRKNSRVPVVLSRTCVCASSGRRLCAVHWLWDLRQCSSHNGRLFSVNIVDLNKFTKTSAEWLKIPGAARASSHSLRRGMAQDILDSSGCLATLLKAGDWNSSAYLQYLRFDQPRDVAGQALIELSDSEEE